jgi:hypothetical protein
MQTVNSGNKDFVFTNVSGVCNLNAFHKAPQ